MIDHLAALLAIRGRALTLSVATTGSISLAATTTGYTRAQATGTVSANAGVATFSTSQAGVIANGGTITVAGTIYTVSAFDGTTSCTLSDAPTFGASAFTVSFVADGLVRGAEITAAGFTTPANNGQGIVDAVAALTLTLSDAYTVTLGVSGYTVAARTLATEAAAAGRTISVGLPAMRAWENTVFAPVAGKPYVEEDYLPGPVAQVTLGPLGQVETLPQYILKIYGLSGKGTSALYKMADALLLLYPPRQSLTLSTGDVVTVGTQPAPYRGQVLPGDTGWSVVMVTIPCTTRSANSI